MSEIYREYEKYIAVCIKENSTYIGYDNWLENKAVTLITSRDKWKKVAEELTTDWWNEERICCRYCYSQAKEAVDVKHEPDCPIVSHNKLIEEEK